MTDKSRNGSQGEIPGKHVPVLVMVSLVAIIAFISLSGMLHLYMVANQRTDTVQSLQLVARYAEQLRRYEGTVLSSTPADAPDLGAEAEPIQAELNRVAGDAQISQLNNAFNVYVSAFREEAALIAEDNIGSAVIAHRERTVPAGIQFRDDVDRVLTAKSGAADAAQMRAIFGMVLAGVLGFALICGLIFFFDRNRKATISLITRQERRFRSLVEHGADVTVIVDGQGVIQFVTPAVKTVFGADVDQVLGQVLIDMCRPDDRAMVRDFLYDALGANGAPVHRELRFPRPGGTVITMDATAVSRLSDTAVEGIVITARDISDRKALLESLEHKAHHDSLTGLPNRLLLADRLEQAINRSLRQKTTISVLFLDLDGFKAINDLVGHVGGDQLLVAVAKRLQAALRLEDTLARLGGDEFVIVLEQCDESLAVVIANRLIERLGAITVDHQEFDVEASIGIAVRTDSSIAGDELIRRSDNAMYLAKADPNSSVAIYREQSAGEPLMPMAGD